MIIEITNIINKNGFFVGTLLGKEDDWNGNDLTKEELLNCFKGFEIMYYAEKNISKI